MPAPARAATPDLIQALLAIGRRQGLSQTALARACGIDPAALSRAVRPGGGQRNQPGRPLGIVACARIVEAYPELADAAARYLADGPNGPLIAAVAALTDRAAS